MTVWPHLFLKTRWTQGLFDPDVRAGKWGCVLYNWAVSVFGQAEEGRKKTGKERCWCIEVNVCVVYTLSTVKTENTYIFHNFSFFIFLMVFFPFFLFFSSSFPFFFSFSVVRARLGKSRREVLSVKMTFFFCKKPIWWPQWDREKRGFRNGPFEGDPACMFFISLFPLLLFFSLKKFLSCIFSNVFHCWHEHQSLTVDVSSEVSASRRCGVLTT